MKLTVVLFFFPPQLTAVIVLITGFITPCFNFRAKFRFPFPVSRPLEIDPQSSFKHGTADVSSPVPLDLLRFLSGTRRSASVLRSAGKTPRKPVPRVFQSLQNYNRCYSLLACADDRVKCARFYAQLRDKLLKDQPAECHLSPLFSFVPHVRDSLVRGYLVKDNSECGSRTERILEDLWCTEEVVVCSYRREDGGQVWTQSLWDNGQTGQCYYVVPSEEPECHPSVSNMVNNDVFYSFEEAHSVIKQVEHTCQTQGPRATCGYLQYVMWPPNIWH